VGIMENHGRTLVIKHKRKWSWETVFLWLLLQSSQRWEPKRGASDVAADLNDHFRMAARTPCRVLRTRGDAGGAVIHSFSPPEPVAHA